MMPLVRRSVAALLSAGLMTGLMVGGVSLSAQDSGKEKTSKSKQGKAVDSPAPSRTVEQAEPPSKAKTKNTPPDVVHRVPAGYSDLGLTEEQREAIYKIRGKYYPRIQALEKQVVSLRESMATESEAVLTKEQKKQFEQEKKSASDTRKARAAKARQSKSVE